MVPIFRPNLTFGLLRAWFWLQIAFRVRAGTSRPVHNSESFVVVKNKETNKLRKKTEYIGIVT